MLLISDPAPPDRCLVSRMGKSKKALVILPNLEKCTLEKDWREQNCIWNLLILFLDFSNSVTFFFPCNDPFLPANTDPQFSSPSPTSPSQLRPLLLLPGGPCPGLCSLSSPISPVLALLSAGRLGLTDLRWWELLAHLLGNLFTL